MVFYNIAAAYVNMYRVLAAKPQNKNLEVLGQEFLMGNRSFLLKRAAANLRKFSKEKIDLSLNALIAAERELKTYSGNDRIALEKLIVRLIYISKTGEALD